MALIKCPECGKDVSTAAEACPHCGFPLKKETASTTTVKENYPKPISSSWIRKWESKAKTTKVIWTVLFVLCVVFLIISLALLFNDRVTNDYGYAEAKSIHVVFSGVFGFLTFITFSFWLAVLISVRVRARQYDGYTVLVYTGFKNRLVVENRIQDSGIINRFLYGSLPNKKQVWASISAWDASVKMGIGNEGDGKQLI